MMQLSTSDSTKEYGRRSRAVGREAAQACDARSHHSVLSIFAATLATVALAVPLIHARTL